MGAGGGETERTEKKLKIKDAALKGGATGRTDIPRASPAECRLKFDLGLRAAV